jgi:hypothetical protein
VGFVNDDEVPTLLPDALSYVLLFGVVEGGDYERFPLPEVDELLLVLVVNIFCIDALLRFRFSFLSLNT